MVSVPLACPVCGTPTVTSARFCYSCGALLDTSELAAEATAERRIVTVLFGDLSDFTAWAEGVDPERVGVVTDHVLAVLGRSVTDHGGTIDKLTGDGLMAVFGAPTAHEDDIERAVRAAAHMQSAVRRVMEEESGGGRRMGLRVGLNTGEVLAGVQASLSYTVVGDTVNTASRLSDAASIGAVYAGRSTALATMSIASWRALPPLRLKGKREPVPAYELVGIRPPGAARIGLGEEAPFIGRDAEFGRLVGRVLDVVERGKPASVVVTGDAGVGKTRLALELAEFAGELPAVRVLWGRCAPYGESRELSALADWMRTAVGITEDDDTDAAIARVRRTVARLAAIEDARPVTSQMTDRLLALLGLVEWAPIGPRDTATPGAVEVSRDPMVEAVGAVLQALQSEGPLVLVIDDAQWATNDLLRSISRLADDLPGAVMFVTVGRPDLLGTTWWERMPDPEVLPVSPLDEAASERLLRAYLDGVELDPETRDQLLSRAQGNPFFLAELLHLLVDRDLLRREGDGWQLVGELPREVLPAGVQAVLAARIDGLSPIARTLARDASVIGNRFTFEMFRALTPVEGDSEQVALGLDELVSRGIVRPTADGSESAPQFVFTHALARDVAYAGIPKGERARRHATVARWAIDGLQWSAADTDAFVASQSEQAVVLASEMNLAPSDLAWSAREIGFGALDRLGEAALARDDNGRAETLLTRALELGAGDVPEPAVARTLVRRAAARVALHRHDEAEVDLDLALASTDQRIRATALVVHGDILRRRGEDHRATRTLVTALALASDSGFDRVTGEALRQLGMMDFLAARLSSAEERFGQALSLAERVGDRRGAGWALQHLAWTATTRGDYDAAARRLVEARGVFASLDDEGGMSWCAGTEAFIRLLQGRLAEARELAQSLLPMGRAIGDGWGTAACLTIDGFAAAELGLIKTALDESAAAFDQFEELGDTWGQCMASIASAAALRGQGRQRKAIRRLELAVDLALKGRNPLPAALATVSIGYCRLDLGDASAAESAARLALEQAEGLDLRPGALVSLRVLLAQALRARGKTEEAVQLLREAQVVADSSLAFPRRQALAHLAGGLLELGETAEALRVAHEAMAQPAQDVRSRIVALRVLGACLAAAGDPPAARFAVRQATALSAATEMSGELSASQKALSALRA
ncbi:MAG TPA: adenylate/guanylate cyclase domain-containing protein [Mycobacteriales bacterium]|nr:adenylate/guanylate cyclase domain-containing protein [Mycobacteriales bacterium]